MQCTPTSRLITLSPKRAPHYLAHHTAAATARHQRTYGHSPARISSPIFHRQDLRRPSIGQFRRRDGGRFCMGLRYAAPDLWRHGCRSQENRRARKQLRCLGGSRVCIFLNRCFALNSHSKLVRNNTNLFLQASSQNPLIPGSNRGCLRAPILVQSYIDAHNACMDHRTGWDRS